MRYKLKTVNKPPPIHAQNFFNDTAGGQNKHMSTYLQKMCNYNTPKINSRLFQVVYYHYYHQVVYYHSLFFGRRGFVRVLGTQNTKHQFSRTFFSWILTYIMQIKEL